MAAALANGLRIEVLAAYESLAHGDSAPLAALLDPRVDWLEPGGSRLSGRDPVAALLSARAHSGSPIRLRGVAPRGEQLVLEFASPWWERERRLASRLAALALGTAYIQTLTVRSTIERIVCEAAPLSLDEQIRRNELLELLLR